MGALFLPVGAISSADVALGPRRVSEAETRASREVDPRAGVPCRVACLLFSLLTAICLLMPWVTYRSDWLAGDQASRAALSQAAEEIPLVIPGVPGVIGALARSSVGAAVLFALASLACAAALALIVLGGVRVLRFRGGVGLLRGGLAIVALVVVLGGPAIVVFHAGISFSAFSVTDWPGYALLCAAVASVAASRYGRLVGPDVDADDARIRAEGFAVEERRMIDSGAADDWYDSSTRVALSARPGRAEVAVRAIACVAGALGVVLAVPLLASTVLAVATDGAWLGEGTMVGAKELLLESPYLLAWVGGAAALICVAQGIVAFARDHRTTGLLRTGALLMLFGPPLSGMAYHLPRDLMYALLPGMTPGDIDGAYIAYVLVYIALVALAAFLSGLADGMAFARVSRTVE